MIPVLKTIVTAPDQASIQEELGDRVVTLPRHNTLPSKRIISMRTAEFQSGLYEGNMVLQRSVIIVNRVGNVLVTQFGKNPEKFLTTTGKGHYRYSNLLSNKLPNIIPENHGFLDFGVCSPCATDPTSRFLFLGRVFLGHPERDLKSLEGKRNVSWESPASLYRSNELNPLQRSILLWMCREFGGK